MSDTPAPRERTPDDDWAELVAGRPAAAADPRTAHEAALLRRAIGHATEAASGPASAAEQQALDRVHAHLSAQWQAGAAPVPTLATPTPPRRAANEPWYSPRHLALAASLVLAVGIGTLAVRTVLPPEDIEVRAPADRGLPQIYSRDPAALAESIRARLEPLGAKVTVEARRDGARLVQGTLPTGARLEGGNYLQELGIATDPVGAFRVVVLPSLRSTPQAKSTPP
jgi:hypothetical protein